MERRRENRVSRKGIPREYSMLKLFLDGTLFKGTVNDISKKGISIDIPIAANKIRDYMIKLSSLDNSLSTTEEIANFSSIKTGGNGTRIGVLFSSDNIFYSWT